MYTIVKILDYITLYVQTY